MTEVDEHFRAPLFRQAVLLLRAGVPTAIETEQADDIQRLLETKDPRNSRPYLSLANRIHERFRDHE